MGIKPNLHWVIKSLPDGDMEIMPVKGWYDLATTGSSHDPRRSARPGVTGHATPQRDAAVMELQQQAMVRKESADRWDAISKRRMQRIEESGGARRAFPLAEDLDAAKASEEKRRKVQIMYPEDPDAADDTGFKHQEEKRRKVLQKLQKAQDAGTEEQAVPDVASTLLDLKRQGEGAWDFSDEEEFSDDEEKVAPEANPKEVEGLPEEDANLPSGDEEDEETKPEATLSGVGEELKVLLKVDPETAESPPRFEEPMEAGSPDQALMVGRCVVFSMEDVSEAENLPNLSCTVRTPCHRVLPFPGFFFVAGFTGSVASLRRMRRLLLVIAIQAKVLTVAEDVESIAERLGSPSARDYLLRRELLRSGLSHSTDPEEVEMESEAEDTASSLAKGLANATSITAETATIREEPPLEEAVKNPAQASVVPQQNVTLLAGPAGRPALIVAGMYGPGGAVGPQGPEGPAGPQGPAGPAGASVVGPAGRQGTPGQRGKMGKTGKVGAKGHAGSPGEPGKPCEDFHKWSQLLDYYTKVVTKMEAAAGTYVRGVNREVSMLQQQSAIYQARTYALSNGSMDLHNYMVANYKRMVKSASSAKEVDEYLSRMSMVTPLDALHDAQRLYPAFLGTQRVALVMEAAQNKHQGHQGHQGRQGQFSGQPGESSHTENHQKSSSWRQSLSLFLVLPLVLLP
eukprot:symbB.v1.2.003782.t1/scaffold214.1/size264264/4